MSELSYIVLRNAEEQHSLWPAHREVPEGWEQVTAPSSKDECLAYVTQHWTDIRPKSLREKLASLRAGE